MGTAYVFKHLIVKALGIMEMRVAPWFFITDSLSLSMVSARPASTEDLRELEPWLRRWCGYFGRDPAELLAGPFTVVTPDSRNPYRQMYVAN